jgi:hypothetical protein
MEKILALFVWIALGSLLSASPGGLLDLSNPPPSLSAIIDSLEKNQPVKSNFRESRSTSFLKRKNEFEGIMFWHPDYGLSLQYHSPRTVRINVSKHCLTIKRQEREIRRVEVSEDDPSLSVFYKLFAWDKEWFTEHFSASYTNDGEDWSLRLEPREDAGQIEVRVILLSGSEDRVSKIGLHLTGNKEIEIELFDQEIPWQADSHQLKQQFESVND